VEWTLKESEKSECKSGRANNNDGKKRKEEKERNCTPCVVPSKFSAVVLPVGILDISSSHSVIEAMQ